MCAAFCAMTDARGTFVYESSVLNMEYFATSFTEKLAAELLATPVDVLLALDAVCTLGCNGLSIGECIGHIGHMETTHPPGMLLKVCTLMCSLISKLQCAANVGIVKDTTPTIELTSCLMSTDKRFWLELTMPIRAVIGQITQNTPHLLYVKKMISRLTSRCTHGNMLSVDSQRRAMEIKTRPPFWNQSLFIWEINVVIKLSERSNLLNMCSCEQYWRGAIFSWEAWLWQI